MPDLWDMLPTPLTWIHCYRLLLYKYIVSLCLNNSLNFLSECGSHLFGIVKCTSLSYFYRECDVPGAEAIHLIKLHQNMSRERCEFKSTFGFRDNVVWVTDGCSGVFYLCYDGGRHVSGLNFRIWQICLNSGFHWIYMYQKEN